MVSNVVNLRTEGTSALFGLGFPFLHSPIYLNPSSPTASFFGMMPGPIMIMIRENLDSLKKTNRTGRESAALERNIFAKIPMVDVLKGCSPTRSIGPDDTFMDHAAHWTIVSSSCADQSNSFKKKRSSQHSSYPQHCIGQPSPLYPKNTTLLFRNPPHSIFFYFCYVFPCEKAKGPQGLRHRLPSGTY